VDTIHLVSPPPLFSIDIVLPGADVRNILGFLEEIELPFEVPFTFP
jgi:hypothetical protein